MSHDVRLRKEAFVTGHTGTTWLEVHATCALPILLLLIRTCRLLRLCNTSAGTSLVADFLVLVVPVIGPLTGLGTPISVMAASAVAVGTLWLAGGYAKAKENEDGGDNASKIIREGLSAYRATLMLTTCICILGVDFHAFPRRFAKAETYGTGLMDVGVGSFVAASALAQGFNGRVGRGGQAVGRELRRAAFLLTLGLLRLLSTRGMEYQSHASEYGMHWNFFFTLGALRLAALCVEVACGRRGGAFYGVLGLGTLAVHQTALQGFGWVDVIHSDSRTPSVLSANKEGLGSLPGYLALHLLSLALGAALRRCAACGRPRAAAWAAAAALQASFLLALSALQAPSRRACNAPYVLWILALNGQTALGFGAALALARAPTPPTLHAVNASMLPFFLVANLATGAVNLSIDTLGVGDWEARGVLLVYMVALVVGASAWAARR